MLDRLNLQRGISQLQLGIADLAAAQVRPLHQENGNIDIRRVRLFQRHLNHGIVQRQLSGKTPEHLFPLHRHHHLPLNGRLDQETGRLSRLVQLLVRDDLHLQAVMVLPRGNVAAVNPVLYGSAEFPSFRVPAGKSHLVNTVLRGGNGDGFSSRTDIRGIRRGKRQGLFQHRAPYLVIAHGGGISALVARGTESGARHGHVEIKAAARIGLAVQPQGNQAQIQGRSLAADGRTVLHAHKHGSRIPDGASGNLDQLLIPVYHGSLEGQPPDPREGLPVQGELHGIPAFPVQHGGLLLHVGGGTAAGITVIGLPVAPIVITVIPETVILVSGRIKVGGSTAQGPVHLAA
ncbi:unknown [Akkermansia sp. CAG:344]|nr:unknown [Akkermansia sp. CAG:344]